MLFCALMFLDQQHNQKEHIVHIAKRSIVIKLVEKHVTRSLFGSDADSQDLAISSVAVFFLFEPVFGKPSFEVELCSS